MVAFWFFVEMGRSRSISRRAVEAYIRRQLESLDGYETAYPTCPVFGVRPGCEASGRPSEARAAPRAGCPIEVELA